MVGDEKKRCPNYDANNAKTRTGRGHHDPSRAPARTLTVRRLKVWQSSFLCRYTMIKILSRYYQDIIKMFSRYYQDVIKILSRYYQNIIKILSRYYQDIIKMLSRYCQNIIKILSTCYQDIIKILSRYYQDIIKIYTGPKRVITLYNVI